MNNIASSHQDSYFSFSEPGDILTPEEQRQLDDELTADSRKPVNLNLDADYQRRILGAMVCRPGVLQQFRNHGLHASYFADNIHKRVCELAYAYFDKYGTTPPADYILNEFRATIDDAKERYRYTAEFSTLASEKYNFYTPDLLDAVADFCQKSVFAAGVDKMFKNKNISPEEVAKLAERMTALQSTSPTRKAMSLTDLINLNPPPWLVESLLPAQSLCCLFGPSGRGKTFAALDLALSVASGKRFADRFSVKQSSVAYVISEGQAHFGKRAKVWLNHHKQAADAIPFAAVPYSFDLTGEGDNGHEIVRLAEQQLGHKPDVVIIDTVARNFGGGDEDRAKDMSRFVASCDSIRALTGGTVIVVHHTGKDATKKERGSSALRAAVDTLIEVALDDDQVLTLRCEKAKDSAPFAPIYLQGVRCDLDGRPIAAEMEIDSNRSSLIFTALDQKPENLNDRLLFELDVVTTPTKENCHTAKQLSDKTGIQLRTCQRNLTKLVEAGILAVIKLDSGQNQPNYYYRMPA